MRHRRKGRVLGRSPAHQRALLRNLAAALMLTERDTEADERRLYLDTVEPVLREGMHVDPLNIMAKCVIDGTGHEASVCRVVARKIPGAIIGIDGVKGEKPMWAEVGERTVVEMTQEVYPGLVVAGMAAAAVCGGPRMGPIFGGMLQSGEKAAGIVIENLNK